MDVLRAEFNRLKAEQFSTGSNAEPLEPIWFSELARSSVQLINSSKDPYGEVSRGISANFRNEFASQLKNELSSAEQRLHSLEEKVYIERFTIDYLRSTIDKLCVTSDVEDVNSSTRSSSGIGAVALSSPRNSLASVGPDIAQSGSSSPTSELDLSSSIGVVFERKRPPPASPSAAPLLTSLSLRQTPPNGEYPTHYANIEPFTKPSLPFSLSKPSPPERTSSSSIHRQMPLAHTPRSIYGGTLRGDRSSGGIANLPPPVPEHRKSKSVEKLQLVGTSQPSTPPSEPQTTPVANLSFKRSAKEPVYEQIWEPPQSPSVAPKTTTTALNSNTPPKLAPEAFYAVSNIEKSSKPNPPQLSLREIVSSQDTYSTVADVFSGNMSKSPAASNASRAPVPPAHPPPAPPAPPLPPHSRAPPPLEQLSSFVGKSESLVSPVVLRHAEAIASQTTSSSSPVLPARASAAARLSGLELDANSVSNPLSDDDEDDDLDQFLLDADRAVVYENGRAAGTASDSASASATATASARPLSRASKASASSSGGEPSPAVARGSKEKEKEQPASTDGASGAGGANGPLKPNTRRRSDSHSALSTSSTDLKTATTAAARETPPVPEKTSAAAIATATCPTAPLSASASASAGPSSATPAGPYPSGASVARAATIRPMTLGERLTSNYETTVGVFPVQPLLYTPLNLDNFFILLGLIFCLLVLVLRA